VMEHIDRQVLAYAKAHYEKPRHKGGFNNEASRLYERTTPGRKRYNPKLHRAIKRLRPHWFNG
jgi:hypothetical protein